MVAPKCLLDVDCDSTMAQRSVGFPRSFATSCSRYLGYRRQVLYLPRRDWCHYRIHLHRPASFRLDDQVFVEIPALAPNPALILSSQAQRGNREQHERG